MMKCMIDRCTTCNHYCIIRTYTLEHLETLPASFPHTVTRLEIKEESESESVYRGLVLASLTSDPGFRLKEPEIMDTN